jgi:hypothetical protein
MDRERDHLYSASSTFQYASLTNLDQLAIRSSWARVERIPDRLDRLACQPHLGLLRSAVRLALVALQARQYAVVPPRLAALGTRDDVVDRQFLRTGLLAAVLAGVMVALENVPAAERDTVAAGSRSYSVSVITSGTRRRTSHCLDEAVAVCRLQLRPVLPRVGLIVAGIHDTSGLVPQQHQCTRYGGHMSRPASCGSAPASDVVGSC